MPGMMYIPPRGGGGGSGFLGNLLTQIALMKIAQNFKEQEADIETEKAMAVKGWTKEAPPSGGGAATEGIKEPEGGPTPPETPRKVTLRGQTYYQGPLEIQQIPGTRYVRIGRGIDETFLESKGKQFSTPVTLQGKEGAVTGFLQVDDEGKLVLTGKMPGETAPRRPTPKTIYGPGGATKEVWISPGEEYVPPKGWTLKTPPQPFNIIAGVDARGNPIVVPGRGEGPARTVPSPTGEPVLPRSSTILTEDEKKDYTALGNATDLINQLEAQWNKVAPDTRLDASATYAKAKTGYAPDAKVYIDQREGFLGQLSRSIAAERGVLTNQDIERINKTMPRMGANPLDSDNKTEAKKKWNSIFRILKMAEKRMYQRTQMKSRTSVEPEAIVKRGKLDRERASEYLQAANGNPDLARQMAHDEGWEF